MARSRDTLAVLLAMAATIGVAIAELVAGVLTGSSAMLSEVWPVGVRTRPTRRRRSSTTSAAS